MDELYIIPSMSATPRYRLFMIDRGCFWLDPLMAELTDSAVTLEELGEGDSGVACESECLDSMPLAKANLRLPISTTHRL